jgi:hypothetical protein
VARFPGSEDIVGDAELLEAMIERNRD